MTAPHRLAVRPAGPAGQDRTIVRCLSGQRPEHKARAVVTAVLAGLGLHDSIADAEQVTAELVTNARQHAPGPYELRIGITDASVKIAVMDGGHDHAEIASRLARAGAGVPPECESGRGLQIVTALFHSFGVEATSSCAGHRPAKQVWVTVPRTDAAALTANTVARH